MCACAIPDGALLGAGQYRDGLGELAVGRQRPVRVHVRAQHVRQDGRVTLVGLAARGRVPVAVAGHRHRVDWVDLAAGRPQAGHQQPPRGLDCHRDRVFRAVTVPGEQFQQPGQACCVIADPLAGQHLPVSVHEGDVVVVLRPVDPAEYVQFSPPLACCVIRAGPDRAGHARSLMEGLKGSAIRLAVRDPGCPQAPVLARAWRLPVPIRGSSCRWLRTRPTSPPQRPLPGMLPGVSRVFLLQRDAAGTGISS